MRKLSRKIARYAREHTAKFVFGVAVGVAGVVLGAVVLSVLDLNSGGGSSTTVTINQARPRHPMSSYGDETDLAFTAENTVRSGVWALKSPVMESFSGRGEPPVNATRWLPNETVVYARCARPGTWYELELNGHGTRWRFFAELEDGTYVAMGGFKETSEDGAQHLKRCMPS